MDADVKVGRLSFFGGDFNQVFNPAQTGKPWTKNHALFDTGLVSSWQLLGKYPDTGHGNIDAIGTVKSDKRVVALKAAAYSDKAWPLNTDHFTVSTTWKVTL